MPSTDDYTDRAPTRSGDERMETRTRTVPRSGTRECLLAAAALLLVGLYFLFSPVFYSTGAGNLACGSAISPTTSEFARNVCASLPTGNLYKAVLAFALAVVVAVLGARFYGVDRTVQTRAAREVDLDD